MIYTSGSTGQAEGRMVDASQRRPAVRARTDAWFGFGPRTTFGSLFHSYAFDFSVWEIWGALLYGGRLVVVAVWVTPLAGGVPRRARRRAGHRAQCDPGFFKRGARRARSAERIACAAPLIFGGEALQPPALRPWFDRFGDDGRVS